MSEPIASGMTTAKARELHQAADALLRSIYEKKVAWSARSTAYQQKMRSAYATVKEDAEASMAWQRLLNHLGPRTDLLAVEPVFAYLGPQPGNTSLDALLHLALRHSEWRRPLEDWEPTASGTREQFHALLRCLLADYFTPSFLDAAWFEGFTPEGASHRDWFLHIGGGQNLRTVALPLPLTSRAAHHFLEAPEESSIVGALRWGQTLALGGDTYLAQAIAASRLGSILPDEPFWASVIHFFVNNQSHLDTAWVGPIVDFLFAQKFGAEAKRGPDGQWDCSDAPEPSLIMKGRTLPAMQQRVREWHEMLARDAKRPRTSWEATGIQPLNVQERDPFGMENEWRIVELLSSTALMEEGREMRHCVFSYAPACQRGTTSIWSLRVRRVGEARLHRLLTVEVNNGRRAIVQARGRCNLPLASHRGGRASVAGGIIRRWAREQRLTVACGL